MDSISKNFKEEFTKGSILNKIIYINIIVFLVLSILNVLCFMLQININPILKNFIYSQI